ncbi:MAG TPA: Hsp20/alpha crystallin family protein [Candidatus Binataceae bacterium]|nr:Hsp20/alpha crystallin family protein [Candidatus Binataceae bacterium]
MKRSDTTTLREFERACDELFDEWLGRWRGGGPAAGSAGGIAGAVVVDRGQEYEVRIEAPVENPEVIEVEVNQVDLVVRIPAGTYPAVERRMTFASAIDRDRTVARWADGVLTIVLPKSRGRRIKVQ